MAQSAAQESLERDSSIVEVSLLGHLTLEQLRASLTNAGTELGAGGKGLSVDCRGMTSYDTEAREYFVDWNKRMRTKVRRLAVITDRTMWHLVVSGMALASGQAMKAFGDVAAARSWLQADATARQP